MNGESVPRLVEGFFQPLRTALDCIFVAGVSCGVGRLAAFSWRCWRGFRIFCLPFGRCTRGSLKDRFGEWAVIVGATSDIGLAYAEELARRGMNVVLISKSYDDLIQLVAKIQSEYSVQAYGIHADFSLGLHVYEEINAALDGYEIGILVNCVAVTYDHPQFFVLIPPQRLLQILNVNITATTLMTYNLLPQMLERQKGAIINVCSQIATLPPSPLLSSYAASMAYVKTFSESLCLESKRRGIVVQTLLPCFVASHHTQPSFFYSHTVYLQLATILCPECLWSWLVSHLLRRHRHFSITQAKTQGTEQFTRRKRSSVTLHNFRQPIGQPAHKRVSGDLGLVLRRSPSPKRKSSAATTTPLESPHPLLSRDANYFPSRPPSANISSPIPESPVSPFPSPRFFPPGSKNSKQPSTFDTSTPLPTAYQGGGNLMTPRRSLTTSSAQGPNSLHHRQLPFRHSRVMVIPSVARDCQRQNLDSHTTGHSHHTEQSDNETSS